MKISFGRKQIIALAQIQNKKTGKFESATVYEIDCKDHTDYIEAQKDYEGWNFPYEISQNILCKFINGNRFKNYDPYYFYALQNENFETIGRIQINENDRGVYTVEWLDTKENNGYRFVGQTILAVAAKEALAKGAAALSVPSPMEDAENFYKDVCKFEDWGKSGFYTDKKGMEEFIGRTEERTQCPLIDLKA